MADIINLNQKRKERAKAEKKAKASENRAAFGRTKAEKMLEEARAELEKKRLDGGKADTRPSPDDKPS